MAAAHDSLTLHTLTRRPVPCSPPVAVCRHNPSAVARAVLRLMLVMVACLAIASDTAAQSAKKAAPGTLEVEPYTGPPIYLPQTEQPPPPSAVETQTLKQNYEGTDIPRFERGLIRYSDESVKSDGIIKEYFSNGQLFVEGQYSKGQPTGEWTYYHKNGQIAKRVTFVSGRPDGKVDLLREDGKRLATRQYANGKRDSVWTYFDETGEQPLREERYTSGKADGEWKSWYTNGQMRQVTTFKDGSLNGVAKEWGKLGEQRAVAEFKDGKRHGKTTQWQPDGKVIERLYDEGKLVDQSKPE
ncbi:toxin-antitoxin system YwqK family antitoxin [Botrimarina hoheduenensis]|uniref:MORN repeat variant n=1 Tax=Botrimarina hoheduenensis TaxID=2528000 RepID=A0A5C5WBX0_9BACT|nr:toxin-antitoxin system YwqK family antitoxin [Botrimarina hoheduenensis]TWT47579.1 MORN repeat variant [Botrimarina hoheduenensis]